MKTSGKKKKQNIVGTKKKQSGTVVKELGNDVAALLRWVMDGNPIVMQKLALAEILGEMLAPIRSDVTGEQYAKQGAERAALLGDVLGGMLIREWGDTPGEQFSKKRAEQMAEGILEKLNEDSPEIAGAALLQALVRMPDVWKDSIDEEARDRNRDELIDTIHQSDMSYSEQADLYKGLLGMVEERKGKKLQKTA